MEPQGDVTRLLADLCAGKAEAEGELLSAVYGELHELARLQMQGERPGHTLQPTALVNEAWLRLFGESDGAWESRAHFLRVAARAMRRVLVDHARRKRSDKRGAGRRRRSLTGVAAPPGESPAELLVLDEALGRLTAVDAQASQVFELRYFGGLSVEETARVLGVSPRTVLREWKLAQTWLALELTEQQ